MAGPIRWMDGCISTPPVRALALGRRRFTLISILSSSRATAGLDPKGPPPSPIANGSSVVTFPPPPLSSRPASQATERRRAKARPLTGAESLSWAPGRRGRGAGGRSKGAVVPVIDLGRCHKLADHGSLFQMAVKTCVALASLPDGTVKGARTVAFCPPGPKIVGGPLSDRLGPSLSLHMAGLARPAPGSYMDGAAPYFFLLCPPLSQLCFHAQCPVGRENKGQLHPWRAEMMPRLSSRRDAAACVGDAPPAPRPAGSSAPGVCRRRLPFPSPVCPLPLLCKARPSFVRPRRGNVP
ncbi:hypothetical protein CDD83_5243 [Cordyceps sp. RAO-2017]|nr:hypothetical protein CDD83_5243 [Cordyceps sp. RAO-2017]